jgi:carboxyl-terminal processing protease
MIRSAIPLIIITAAACHRAPPAAAPVPMPAGRDTIALTARLDIVTRMDAHVRAHFAHWTGMGGRSYDSIVTAFRGRATDAHTRYEFDLAAMAFTAGLSNGHTRFGDSYLRTITPGAIHFRVFTTPEGWLVTSSAYPQLRTGELIRTINNEPFEAFYQRNRAYLPESSERLRRVRLTLNAALFPQTFVLGLASGRQARIVRSGEQDSLLRARTSATPFVPHRWIVKDSVAYIMVSAWQPSAYEDSALTIVRREYLSAPSLIIDVRGNGGGTTPSRLVSRLTGEIPARTMPVEASSISPAEIGGPRPFGSASAEHRYHGTLVILADHGCASACDDFVSPFFDNHAATVVGDTTWGSTGQPRFLNLGNGMTFQVSARRYTLYDGTPFEGAGVPPHVFVPLRSAELLNGQDTRLERAIAIARAGGGRH